MTQQNDVKKFCDFLGKNTELAKDKSPEELFEMFSKTNISQSSGDEEIKQEELVEDIEEGASSSTDVKKDVVKLDEENDELSPESLTQANVAMLKSLCKKYKLKVGGKKAELVERLLGVKNKTIGLSSIASTSKTKKKKKKDTDIEKTPLYRKIEENIPRIQIKRNTFGNFEHTETSFVFDSVSKSVYGKQIGENIESLTKEDIQLCHKYHFTFAIPENLGSVEDTAEDMEQLDKKILEEYE